MHETTFFAIVLAILVLNIAIAFFRNRNITFQIYAADPHAYRWPIVTITITSTIVGGGMFLGVGQIGYEAGVTGWVIGLIYLVGFILTGILAVKMRSFLDEEGCTTLIDVLDAKYGSRIGVQFSAVCGLMYTFLLAGQFIALLWFVEFLQPQMDRPWLPWVLVGLAAVSLFVYPFVGGLRKDIQTDVIQFIIVGVAAVFLVSVVANPDTLSDTLRELPATKKNGLGYGLLFIVGAALFLPGSFLVRMDIWQRVKVAKDVRHVRTAFWLAGLAAFFFFWLFTTVGMHAFALGTERGAFATLDVIRHEFSNPIVIALLVGGFFAAIIGSADTLINNVSLFAARAFTPRLWHGKQGDGGPKLLWASRLWAIAVILVAVGLAFIVPNFVDLLIGAFSLLLVFLPLMLGLFVPRMRNAKAAFWSANLGLIVFFALFFGGMPKIAFAPAVVLSLIFFFVMRLFWKSDAVSSSTA